MTRRTHRLHRAPLSVTTLASLVLIAGLPLAVAGCPKDDKASGGAPQTSATASATSAPSASNAAPATPTNAAKITRYKDENAVSDVATTVKRAPATVFSAAPKGDVVAQLKVGDAVVQHAERNGFYRVSFVDPAHAGQRLTGWLDTYATSEEPPPKPKPVAKKPQCKSDEVYAFVGVARCAKVCGDDSECGGGDCNIAPMIFDNQDPTAPGAHTTVCWPAEPKAKTAADAGASVPASASASAAPSASAKPRPKSTMIGINVENMSCPNGYVTWQKVMCARYCKSESDCGTAEKCAPFDDNDKICR